MRKHLGALLPLCFFGALGAACGKIEATVDAAPGGPDAPAGDPDGAVTDAPVTSIDAPITAVDASPDAPPSGPRPQFLWEGENNVNNTGAQTGFTLVTPSGVSYTAGKFGQAMMFASQYSYVDGVRAPLSGYADVTIGWWMRESGATQGQAVIDCNNRATAPYGGMQLGLSGNSVSICLSSTTASYLNAGGCNGFTAPSANVWHHWIMRYDGSGTGAGQGGATQFYIDNVLVYTRANDASNNPVWNSGIPDRLYIGAFNMAIDDVRIYNEVMSLADQCTYVVRGTWTGSSCTLP